MKKDLILHKNSAYIIKISENLNDTLNCSLNI